MNDSNAKGAEKMDTDQIPNDINVKESKGKKLNKKQATIDNYALNPAMQQQLDIMMKKLEKLDTIEIRLEKTVKTDDLDNKMKEMITNTQMTDLINNFRDSLYEEFTEIRDDVTTLRDENEQLRDRVDKLEETVTALTVKTDQATYKAHLAMDKSEDLEQHGRMNSIRVYGLKDTGSDEDENATIRALLTLFKTRLGIELGHRDIDIAHRLGEYDNDKNTNRGIICKFVLRTDRNIVLKARRRLVGTKFVIVEDLSPSNRSVLEKHRKREDVAQVWSSGGKVILKKKSGDIIRVERDIKCALENFEKKHPTLNERLTTEPKYRNLPPRPGKLARGASGGITPNRGPGRGRGRGSYAGAVSALG